MKSYKKIRSFSSQTVQENERTKVEANTRLKTGIRLYNNRLDLLAYYDRKREITLTDVGIICQACDQTFAHVNVPGIQKVRKDTGQLSIVSDYPHIAGH